MRALVWAAAIIGLASSAATADPERENRLLMLELFSEASRFAIDCPDMELDIGRATEIAQLAGVPVSSISKTSNEGATALAAPPFIWTPPAVLNAVQCEWGWDQYGSAGKKLRGLLIRKDQH